MQKLDIFDVTSRIDNGEVDFYCKLDVDTKKTFHPIVVQRWLSSIDSDISILNINSILNEKIFSLHDHPDLLYKLMVACTNQKKNNYYWIKQFTKKHSKPNIILLLQEAYNKTEHECDEIIDMFSLDDLLNICEFLGKDKTFIQHIKNEYSRKN